MSSSIRRIALATFSALALVLTLVLTGCADDPILGPSGPTDDGGGSYGVINQFAPGDTTATLDNPEQF